MSDRLSPPAPHDAIAPSADVAEALASDVVSRALDAALGRFAGAAARLAARSGLDRDDLDELLQEVRIRLWRSLGSAEKIREVRAFYLQRVVGSAVVDLIRRRRARREEPLDPPAGEGGGASLAPRPVPEAEAPTRADAALERAELDAVLRRALDELQEGRRTAVRLHLAGYHREEIAEMLGWSEPKTRNLLYRGLADLREALVRAGVHPGGDA